MLLRVGRQGFSVLQFMWKKNGYTWLIETLVQVALSWVFCLYTS